VEKHFERNVSRRSLLKATGAVGLGLIGAQIFAACGTTQSSSPSGAAPTTAPAAAPTTAPAAAPTTAAAAPTTAAAAPTTAAAAAAPTTASGAAVTLSVISWNSGNSADAFKNAMGKINDAFKQTNPNVTINFEMLGQGDTWTNAQQARIAAQTTDVSATYGFAPADIINFQPDQQFIDLTGLASIKNFDQTNVQRFMMWKDKVWQMTLAYVGNLIWTNEDALTKYDLKHPTTYAEWQAMGDKLLSNNITPILLGGKPAASLSRWALLAEMNVVRPKNPNFWPTLLTQGTYDFTTPEWVDAFKRAKDFSSKYFDPNFTGIDYPTTAGLFAAGKYPMMVDGSYAGGDIEAAQPSFQNLGAFNSALSDDANANSVHPVYGDIGWAGFRYSKSADTVSKWIDFFGQPENYQSFMQVLQYYPTQKAQITGPVPTATAPLLQKTAVSMVRLPLPGMTLDVSWSELLVGDQYTPETYAQYVQKSLDDSKPQWQKYIGMFDANWAKLYFGQ
jgi:raffinose/stachyose/melibiose transport system substrate-binding protein